jgi:hypothetical protein
MSRKRRRDTPQWVWEQALIDAYYDHRWHEVLDPLTETVERWKAGEVEHGDLARAALRIRKEVNRLDDLFTQKREYLDRLIEFDSDWYVPWVTTHPRPSDGETAMPGADALLPGKEGSNV